MVVAGYENGFSVKACRKVAVAAVDYYVSVMKRLAQARTLDVWYFYVEAQNVVAAFERSSRKGGKAAENMVRKAERKTQEQTLAKLTHIENGQRRINSNPPLLVPLAELLTEAQRDAITEEQIWNMWQDYLTNLPADKRHLLRRYRKADAALRVGGVGSVGTRCWILLMEGGAEDDALVL